MSDRIANLGVKKRKIAEIATTLPTLCRIAYSLSCCERLLPYYHAFSQLTIHSKGNAVRLRELIDELWSILQSAEISHERVHELELIIDEFVGGLDRESGTPFADAALSTLSAVECTLRVIRNEGGGAVEDMIEHSTNGIDGYLNEVTSPWSSFPKQAEYREFRDWLLDSQMLNMELEKHHGDLRLLEAQEQLTLTFIDVFRAETKTVNLFPIGRAIFGR